MSSRQEIRSIIICPDHNPLVEMERGKEPINTLKLMEIKQRPRRGLIMNFM